MTTKETKGLRDAEEIPPGYEATYTTEGEKCISSLKMKLGVGSEPMLPPMTETYFLRSLIALFLFPPIGLFALLSSREVEKRYLAEDYHGSELASMRARRLANVGIVCGILMFLVLAAFLVILFKIIL